VGGSDHKANPRTQELNFEFKNYDYDNEIKKKYSPR
jgi:hypothetical protein